MTDRKLSLWLRVRAAKVWLPRRRRLARFQLARLDACKTSLKQLPHDSQGEVLLKLNPARAQDLVAKSLRSLTGGMEQSGFTETYSSFDSDNASLETQKLLEHRKLALSL